MNDIQNLLQTLQIGPPLQARNLTMFPLLSPAGRLLHFSAFQTRQGGRQRQRFVGSLA